MTDHTQHPTSVAESARQSIGDANSTGYTPLDDTDRAAALRRAERYIRDARQLILDARLPSDQWSIARHDVEMLREIAMSCGDFAESYEWADIDRRQTA